MAKPCVIHGLAFFLSGLLFGCSSSPPTDAFSYPANQSEFRRRLAQTLETPYPATTYEAGVYVVQVADSVVAIAAKLHVTEQELAVLNPGTDLRRLKIGQRLVFYERMRPYVE